MMFLAAAVSAMLVPFILLAVLPGWGTISVAAVVLATFVLSLATTAVAGDGAALHLTTLIAAGAISGVVTAGIGIVLREREAPWHVRVVTIGAGVVACVPVWLLSTFVVGTALSRLNGF